MALVGVILVVFAVVFCVSSLLGIGCWFGVRVCCHAISLAMIASKSLSDWLLISIGQVDLVVAAGIVLLFGLGFLLQAEGRWFGVQYASLCVVL